MAPSAVTNIAKGQYGFTVSLGVPEGTLYVSAERRANGITMPVEGAVNITVPGGTAQTLTVTDVSALQNTPVEYRAVSLWSDGTTSELVKGEWTTVSDYLDFGSDYLFHATRPDIRLPVTVESFPEQASEITQEIVFPLDRPDPIVISGRRRYPSAQLTVLTFSDAERRDMRTLMNSTDVVAFSPWQSTYGFDKVTYWALGKVTESRVTARGFNPLRRWKMEIQQVEPPLPENPVTSRPTPVPPPSSGGDPITNPPPGVPDPEGSIVWEQYLSQRWSALASSQWGEVAGI